jgi:3-mercaptopyruvate sulfurtransferase SseA
MLNQRAGHDIVRALVGGWNDWVKQGNPVTTGAKP